jgi:acetyl-CoA acyltransferase
MLFLSLHKKNISMSNHKVVIVDGTRTPFLKAGTDYQYLMNWQLGQMAIQGLLHQTGIDPKLVDNVVMGCVIHNMKTPNVAREAALAAGIPNTTPCHTVSQACISANQAIASAADLIRLGHAEVVIAGGTDSSSDTPIGFHKAMRTKLFNAQKIRSFSDQLKFIFSLRPKDFLPEKPAIAEYSTGRTMGNDCEILAGNFQVSREEQDELAVRSHQNAHNAWENGTLAREVTEASFPPHFKNIKRDNGVRGDTKLEKIAKLPPAFDRKNGTITAANASFLTDGASAVLLMSEEKAKALGYTPKAEIVDYLFTGQDLWTELLLGPAYAIAKLMKRNNLQLSDIDVFEIHEAFAGQVLANIKALNSESYAPKLGLDKPLGQIDMNKLNSWGGSLSIGHPFGATGGRLVTTTANRLIAENGQYGILAACAAGAHGHAMLIKSMFGL